MFNKIKPVPLEFQNNVALYVRYSDDKQTENSVDGQLRVCGEYCSQHGYRIVQTYIDRAMSGTNDNRPNFQKMIDDAKKQQFAFIVVYRFDRFARNRFDSAIYKKTLEQLGIRVISATEQVGDGDEGIILESIYEAMDEAYSRRLSRITKRGMRETAIKGYWTGGNIPLGYSVSDKMLVINDAEAEAVKLIFDMYADGNTKTIIAKELNARGYKTKKNKPFTNSNMTSILSNRMYIGEYNFDDIERSCPAIVDKDTFDKVQSLISHNKKVMGRKADDTFFELSGKLFCGMCGTAMVGDSGTSRSGEKHYYYTCNNRKKRKACVKKSEKKDFLEWYVCERAVMDILTDDNIKEIAKRIVILNEQDRDTSQLDSINKLIADVDRELDKCVDMLMSATVKSMIDRINDKAADLERQKESLLSQKYNLQINLDNVIAEKDVISFLRAFKKSDITDPDERHYIINALINCVYLYDDKIVIYFNTNNSETVSYIDMLSDLDQLAECSDSMTQGEPLSKLSEHLIITVNRFGIVYSRV